MILNTKKLRLFKFLKLISRKNWSNNIIHHKYLSLVILNQYSLILQNIFTAYNCPYIFLCCRCHTKSKAFYSTYLLLLFRTNYVYPELLDLRAHPCVYSNFPQNFDFFSHMLSEIDGAAYEKCYTNWALSFLSPKNRLKILSSKIL